MNGNIPSYAAGTLYRTGPGTYRVATDDGKEFKASHWFDGFTQVHRFQILPATGETPSTRVVYNSRRTVDGLIENVRKSGRLDGFSFGQKRDPCQSFFKKLMSVFVSSTPAHEPIEGRADNRNVGVTLSLNVPGLSPPASQAVSSGQEANSGMGTLINKTDASVYQMLDPETLEPVGIADQTALDPELIGPFSGAHAKTCPVTGECFNYNLDIAKDSTYRVFCASPSTSKTTILATIRDAPAAYVHSLFLTENYVILCVWGSHYAYRGMTLMYHKNMLDSISATDPKKPCRWYVIDRSPARRGVLATYHSRAFYSFHTINAYEEQSHTAPGHTDIICDLACYDDVSVLKRFYYENLVSSGPGVEAYAGSKGDSTRSWIGRYRLSDIPSEADKPGKPRAAIQVFSAPRNISLELPILNPAFVTKPHRYVYGVTDRGQSSFFDGLGKFDFETRTTMFWQENAQTAGEPIFVQNPEGLEEDDGVLLSVVLDGLRGKSYLLCLDARTMKEMGRAETDVVIGFGFHGLHVPSQGTSKGKTLDV